MIAYRVDINRSFLRQVLKSPEVARDLERRANRVLAAARTAAPVRTGDYAASLHGVVGVDRGRVKARVGTSDPAGRIIEAKHHVLERALEAARG
ncbi:MAG: HK97 gp10 family phage protein [Candidatus Nanopelagicales bacterium]